MRPSRMFPLRIAITQYFRPTQSLTMMGSRRIQRKYRIVFQHEHKLTIGLSERSATA